MTAASEATARMAPSVRSGFGDPASGAPTRPAANNAVGTLGAGLVHYFGQALKLTAVYERAMTGTVGSVEDPKDNLLTVQMQARF